jgi:hypothetical protein
LGLIQQRPHVAGISPHANKQRVQGDSHGRSW